MAEWARFRKYALRMRKLTEFRAPDVQSLGALSVLQFWTINKPLLPNLKSLFFWELCTPFIPYIPLFLSLNTTSILFGFHKPDIHKVMVASMVTTLPRLCPNLQAITLYFLPRDPIITAAVSGILLATNRNTLQLFDAETPLTEEASEVIFNLSGLRSLSVVIERETSLPSASLPNLTKLEITCDNEGGWPRLFHGATLGKLESVSFYPESREIGDFLGAFARVALSSSIQNTLSELHLYTSCSWNPNYSSLLRFTQLVDLEVESPCENGCSSRVDDDTIISLSRAMPKLRSLKLGDEPCGEFMAGVTTKGLVALALRCPNLRYLRMHFQVASLSAPPASPGTCRNTEPTGLWTNCALTDLVVGDMVVPEESVLTVALTLLLIFPRIDCIEFTDEGWEKVEDAIHLSRGIVGCSSKHPFTIP